MTEPVSRRRIHPAIWVAIGAAAALLIAGTAYALLRPHGASTSDRKAQAISLCENELRGRLTPPTTAQFSGETVQVTGTSWIVLGDVAVRDAAGAITTGQFNCVMILNDGKFEIWLATAN